MSVQPDNQSITQLITTVVDDIRTLIRDQISLAKAELRASVRAAGAGIGFFIAAGVIASLSSIFLLLAIVYGLNAAGLPLWASYLIVGGTFLLVSLVIVFLGVRAVRKIKAPQRSAAALHENIEALTAHESDR